MVFVTAGMGGGTGTGAAPVIARVARELGILTVGVVTKPFQFEGARRMRYAEAGIIELQKHVDTLLIIPNQNLFRVANEKTTFADAFAMADQVLYSGVACITDLMVKEGLINLDFADVRAVMKEMGKAMMGTGEASGEKRAITAAEAAIANPLIDDASMKGARGLLISITGGKDLTLYEVDEAATRIRERSRSRRQHHRRRDLRRKPRGHHPRFGGGDRHRQAAVHAHRHSGREPRRRDHQAKLRTEDARATDGPRVEPAAAVARPRILRPRGSHAALMPRLPPRSCRRRHRGRRDPADADEAVAVRAAGRTAGGRAAAARTFIPPAAERAPLRTPRMPRVDELPVPAQNEIRASAARLAGRASGKAPHVA